MIRTRRSYNHWAEYVKINLEKHMKNITSETQQDVIKKGMILINEKIKTQEPLRSNLVNYGEILSTVLKNMNDNTKKSDTKHDSK